MAALGIEINNQEHAEQIATAAGVCFNPACDMCISRTGEDDILLGGAIYQGYTGVSIGVHTAGFSKNWVNRDLLWIVFDYPFNQLGCERIFAQIPETNTKSLAFTRNMGFKEVAKVADVFPDGAVVVFRLEKSDCKWHNRKP
jgi:RimJ/RimL family protein N-acetyltransferase